MTDLILKLKCSFTDEDKEKCLPVIAGIIELAKISRAKGLLALETKIVQEESVFFKTGLSLVIDAFNPDDIKQILQSMMIADNHSSFELLQRIIFTEGILSIARGESPGFMTMRLNSILGEKYISKVYNDDNKLKTVTEHLNSLKIKQALPESEEFEQVFGGLLNLSFYEILKRVNTEQLITAIHGCSGSLINKVFDNLSLNLCFQICESWDISRPINNEFIISAQNDILKAIKNLESEGLIYCTVSVK